MLTEKPFFSVVMPTYNRANLLPLAIQSVLDQTFDDFELIVCNGGSTDNTKEVVAKISDKRIRYVESKERLSIGDNYQRALEHATGEYITFLSDDDAFAPIMFERVLRVINEQQAQIVAFQICRYFHNADFEYNRKIVSNTLAIPKFTGKARKFEPNQCLKILFDIYGLAENAEDANQFIVPFLANAVYHHKIFSDLKTRVSKLFATTPADMYLAAAVFFVADSYHCLDEPLHVWSQWADNATASPSKKGDKLRAHYEKLLNGNPLGFTPLKFALPTNCNVNAILQAKHNFENVSEALEVDWVTYYVSMYQELKDFGKLGINITQEANEFNESLSRQPLDFQNQVRSRISDNGVSTKQFLPNRSPHKISSLLLKKSLAAKQFLLNNLPSSAKNLLLKMRGHKLPDLPNLFHGKKYSFGNVLETAHFLGDYVKSKSN